MCPELASQQMGQTGAALAAPSSSQGWRLRPRRRHFCLVPPLLGPAACRGVLATLCQMEALEALAMQCAWGARSRHPLKGVSGPAVA